jgi:hypothetical protein
LGLPKLLNQSDIHAEDPDDEDDEDVSEEGHQRPMIAGQCTKLSIALAIFRLTRILSRVLDEVYPSASSHTLSLKHIGALNNELGTWLQSLAPQHRLLFTQDKPSTNLVGSSSPLLVSHTGRQGHNPS